MVLIKHPPKFIYDDNGHLVEVILAAEDYVAYLRSLAAEEDWETLPEHLQDAVDRLLIDEVRTEKDTASDLENVLGGAIGAE
jgi:hypothetical protein